MRSRTAFRIIFMVWLSTLPQFIFAQPIGEVDTAGTTWYDMQHVGSCGRMIAVDTMGYINVVWTNGLDSSNANRHVFFNAWANDQSRFVWSEGEQWDHYDEAAFATLACGPMGYSIPMFHAHIQGWDDYLVRLCCDEVCNNTPALPGVYPQCAVDGLNRVHVTYMYPPNEGSEFAALHYVRVDDACFQIPEWTGMQFMDSVRTASGTIASSRHAQRVAVGWAHPRSHSYELDNDAYVRISENGGNTWQPILNVTQFAIGDSTCCDTTSNPNTCIGDTFRVYTDVSLLFDEADVLHAAFTARPFFNTGLCGGESWGWIDQAGIWHWSEATHNFSLIASAFYLQTIIGGTVIDDGVWQTNVQRPSLAIDTTNGYLYCAYMQYDSNCYSNAGYPMADIFISVSTDNGANWSVGTNVTRTCPGHDVPPPGSMNEREPTLAEIVSGGILHLSYVLDRDAGASVQTEGVATLNEFIYQRIPVDSIATTPLVPNYPLHVDSTGFEKANDRVTSIPTEIELHPAYPNPFNPSTTITFDLSRQMKTSVRIYDVLGRIAATLQSGDLSAGQHRLVWDAGARASGLYFVVLQAGKTQRIQKVFLLR